MLPTHTSRVDAVELTQRAHRGLLVAAKPALYILLLLTVALCAGAYSLRKYGIFSCEASGYGSDGYLGYCGATSYGDYDHGAIWFGLEPAANAAAANAQVLFLGKSSTQFAFSSKATADWFSSLSANYYLLGFSHYENYTFEAPLLRKLHPKATVYVVNLDSFFDQTETGPGKTVMQDESAKTRYEEKRRWQDIHKRVCTAFQAVCGKSLAIFRSRSSGTWRATGGPFSGAPVSYKEDIDPTKLASYTALATEFFSTLPVDQSCTILTVVPTVKTDLATSEALAATLGSKLVAPTLSGLNTFDGYHLDPQSAQRWSAAFLEEAGPQIRKCLSEKTESHIAVSAAAVATGN